MTDTTTLSQEIELHVRSDHFRQLLPQLRESYHRDDYAALPTFMPEAIFQLALSELEDIFREQSHRRDVTIAQSGNTLRKYTNVDRDSLQSGSRVIPAVFQSPALLEYLEAIVSEKVHPIPYVPEEFIAARLHKAGDVHGWHWDDYTWALVWIFKIPEEKDGGSLEYIKGAPWDRADPQVQRLVAAGPIERRHPSAGSAYLLKAGTALHRVSALTRDVERMIVCFSYASGSDLGKPVDHSSMEALYPQSHNRHSG